MNKEERKAFEEWCERELIRPAAKPVAEFAWLASRDHYRKDVAELVEIIERIRDRHLTPLANQEGEDLLRMDLNDLGDALDKLKDQP